MKVFLDYYFSPQRQVWLTGYAITSSLRIQKMARELVSDSSLSFFDRATVAHWSQNKELARKIVSEVEGDARLRENLSANWLWTISMLALQGAPYEYTDSAGYEHWQEIATKYQILSAEKDPNWGMAQIRALQAGIREFLSTKRKEWTEKHKDEKDKPVSTDELLLMIPEEEVDVRLAQLRACLKASDFRHLLPPSWHRRIGIGDESPIEMARLRNIVPLWKYDTLLSSFTPRRS